MIADIDDRITCNQCQRKRGSFFCEIGNRAVVIDLKRRCEDYKPLLSDPDQRSGKERWPELLQEQKIG